MLDINRVLRDRCGSYGRKNALVVVVVVAVAVVCRLRQPIHKVTTRTMVIPCLVIR